MSQDNSESRQDGENGRGGRGNGSSRGRRGEPQERRASRGGRGERSRRDARASSNPQGQERRDQRSSSAAGQGQERRDRRSSSNARRGRGRGREARAQDRPQKSTRVLLVGNLPALASSDFADIVVAAFKQADVAVEDGDYVAGSTFGFVTLRDEKDTSRAIAALHDVEIGGAGTRMTVEASPVVNPGFDPRRVPASVFAEANRTIVVKNLPFSLQESDMETLMAELRLGSCSVSFHYDSRDQTFRGMCFVKLPHVAAALSAYVTLQGRDVGGRKAKVEFKRKAARSNEYEVPDETSLDLMEKAVAYAKGVDQKDLAFPSSLTSFYRRQLHLIADKLHLNHWSEGTSSERHIVLSKQSRPPEVRRSSTVAVPAPRRGTGMRLGTSPSSLGRSAGPLGRSLPASLGRSPGGSLGRSPGSPYGFGGSPYGFGHGTPPKTGTFATTPPSATLIAPRRQPRGPDGTIGFRVFAV